MRTEVDTTDPSNSPERRALDTLIRERLESLEPGNTQLLASSKPRYAYFWLTGEGKDLPTSDGGERIESTSGYVVDSRDRIFAFWLGWDSKHSRPALVRWRAVRAQPDWADDEEYLEARRLVGLLG
jgi:hypothetical protein